MLTPAQIRAQVTAIRKRMANGSRAFAIHAHSAWMGPDHLEVAGEQHRVVSCQSDLQVREALLRSEVEQQPCILLCNFDPAHLADDVLARLAKRRVFHPQPSEVLAGALNARSSEALQSAFGVLKEVETHFLATENTARIRRIGMAFRQLLDDLVRRDWVELSHPKIGFPKPVAAALPSTTEVSRWALLAGRLAEDRRSTEKVEFSRSWNSRDVVSSRRWAQQASSV